MKSQRSYSLDDYFSLEEGSTVRHEFFDGEIFAMAGGTVAHNQIASNLLRELGTALREKPCRALGSDMRLATPSGLLTYPDAMVICGQVALAHGRSDVVTNPVLLVEILSEATRAYDLGEKFDLYKALPSLREFLAVEQNAARVTLFRRTGDSWPAPVELEEGVLPLSSIDVQLSLQEAYDKVFGP